MQEDKKEDKKERKEEKKEDKDLSSRQAIAVLGIALIAMGEEIGSEMAYRTFGHLVSVMVLSGRAISVYITYKIK
jgi:26S proteasome regulatory subunit N1